MSPEQIEGKKLDQRSDIYSLGVILYKMLTGDVPLDKIFQSKIVSGHKADPPEDPVLINPHIPLKFSALILKCLEGDREVRYQTVDEILSGLRILEEEFSISHEKGIKGISRLSTEHSTVKRIKKYLPFSLVLLAVILVGIIWKPWSGLKAPFSQVDRSSVAVLYFENLSSDSDLESWRMGLTELLITDLMQSKFIDVLSSDRIYSLLNALELLKVEKYSTENLAEIADRGHVSYVISGGLLKAGEEIIITLFIKEHRTGEILDSLRVQCANEDQIVRVVDELTQMIKSSLSLSSEQLSGDPDKDVGKITTNSTEAFKYYVRALNHINRDEYPQGIECLEKATNVDSGFALAYRLLGVAYRDQGYFEKGRENLKKAFELADRVSERESLQIQGDFYRSSWTTYDKAFKTYQRLLELYPDDHNGVTSLARLYTAIEDWDSAINLYSKNIRNKVGIYFSYGNIATLYLQKGQYERAVDIVDSYSKEYSDNAPLRWRSVYAHVAQGHYDSACKEMDKAIALNPSDYFNFLIKGDIYHAFGDVEKAQKEYEKSLQGIDRTMILYGRKRLAALFALQGSFVQAIEQIREGLVLAEELGDQTWKAELKLYLSYLYNRLGQPDYAIVECSEVLSIADHFGEFGMYKKALFFLAMSYIEQMSMSKASEVISQIKDISEQGTNRRGMRYYYHLAGRKALSEGKTQIAIEDFQKAIPLLPSQSWPDIDDHALFIEPLAEAFKIAGDLESAEEQYLNILSLRSGRIHYGDIYAKSFYELGRIYEEKGKSKKAVSYYQRYLFYREKADQSHPEITDAAKRLANLKKS
jgi:tetratricopeptide (TPR) repeat protein